MTSILTVYLCANSNLRFDFVYFYCAFCDTPLIQAWPAMLWASAETYSSCSSFPVEQRTREIFPSHLLQIACRSQISLQFRGHHILWVPNKLWLMTRTTNSKVALLVLCALSSHPLGSEDRLLLPSRLYDYFSSSPWHSMRANLIPYWRAPSSLPLRDPLSVRVRSRGVAGF